GQATLPCERPLDAAILVLREATGSRPVVGCLIRPGPSAEVSALVVGECATNLFGMIHHERPVLRHGRADRASLEHQRLHRLLAGRESHRGVSAEAAGITLAHFFAV